jgi:thiamine pyrophosphate-dependent acetolactate synthase large subunit-like protein
MKPQTHTNGFRSLTDKRLPARVRKRSSTSSRVARTSGSSRSARERISRANVTTIVLANCAYAILRLELQRVGAQAGGPRALAQLDLSNPNLDFVALASGMGVPASRATTCEELATQFRKALAESGPHLIEAIVPPVF